MPSRTIFEDSHDNRLELYINEAQELFLNVGKSYDDTGFYEGWITLNKEDVRTLVNVLVELEKDMPGDINTN